MLLTIGSAAQLDGKWKKFYWTEKAKYITTCARPQ